jgi:hypothetical protein
MALTHASEHEVLEQLSNTLGHASHVRGLTHLFTLVRSHTQVTHELSVPGVKVMLLACAAYAILTLSQLKLDQCQITPATKLALKGASLIGAIVLFAMVRTWDRMWPFPSRSGLLTPAYCCPLPALTGVLEIDIHSCCHSCYNLCVFLHAGVVETTGSQSRQAT